MSEKNNSYRSSPTRFKKSNSSSPHEISDASSSSTASSATTNDRSKHFLENRRKIEQHLTGERLGTQSDSSCKKSPNDTFKKQHSEPGQSTSTATKELVAFFDKKQKESFSVGAAKGLGSLVQKDSQRPIAGTVDLGTDIKSLRQANRLMEILEPDSDESATSVSTEKASSSSSSSSTAFSSASSQNESTTSDSVADSQNTIIEAMRTKMELEKKRKHAAEQYRRQLREIQQNWNYDENVPDPVPFDVDLDPFYGEKRKVDVTKPIAIRVPDRKQDETEADSESSSLNDKHDQRLKALKEVASDDGITNKKVISDWSLSDPSSKLVETTRDNYYDDHDHNEKSNITPTPSRINSNLFDAKKDVKCGSGDDESESNFDYIFDNNLLKKSMDYQNNKQIPVSGVATETHQKDKETRKGTFQLSQEKKSRIEQNPLSHKTELIFTFDENKIEKLKEIHSKDNSGQNEQFRSVLMTVENEDEKLLKQQENRSVKEKNRPPPLQLYFSNFKLAPNDIYPSAWVVPGRKLEMKHQNTATEVKTKTTIRPIAEEIKPLPSSFARDLKKRGSEPRFFKFTKKSIDAAEAAEEKFCSFGRATLPHKSALFVDQVVPSGVYAPKLLMSFNFNGCLTHNSSRILPVETEQPSSSQIGGARNDKTKMTTSGAELNPDELPSLNDQVMAKLITTRIALIRIMSSLISTSSEYEKCPARRARILAILLRRSMEIELKGQFKFVVLVNIRDYVEPGHSTTFEFLRDPICDFHIDAVIAGGEDLCFSASLFLFYNQDLALINTRISSQIKEAQPPQNFQTLV